MKILNTTWNCCILLIVFFLVSCKQKEVQIENSVKQKTEMKNVPLADLRTAALKDGLDSLELEKGQELLHQLENASGGFDKWNHYKTGEFIMTADWYGNETNWTTNPQKFSMVCELGTYNSELTLLNGPQKDNTWKIKNDKSYAINKEGNQSLDMNEMILHKNRYKSYWFQLPFRLREASIIASAGEKIINNVNYDVLFITWKSVEPNPEYDQYMIYLNKDTHLISCLEFTLREAHPMATGVSKFENYKEQNGIVLPTSQYIAQGTLDKPRTKLHENHISEFYFEPVRHN